MSYRKERQFSLEGTNFTDHAGVDFSGLSKEELAKLWRKTLDNGMHGLCFSMYEDGQEPGDTITEEQVERRIEIIKPHTEWVRSFSCIEGNEHIPRMAHKHGVKTMVGAWLGDNKEDNEKEIEGLITLAKEGCVDIAAVGNEVLYRNDLTLEELLEYIQRVKDALPGVPVGYVDAYYEFSVHPELVEISDVILSNCYPYWEGCDIDHSLNHMKQMYGQVMDAAKFKKIIITETGCPSKGQSLRFAHSSE
jgi:exo-beta-1,3-glucanase (GH17 family)